MTGAGFSSVFQGSQSHGQHLGAVTGFHAGFVASAILLGVGVVTASLLPSGDGHGERVNLIGLQAGSQAWPAARNPPASNRERVVSRSKRLGYLPCS